MNNNSNSITLSVSASVSAYLSLSLSIYIYIYIGEMISKIRISLNKSCWNGWEVQWVFSSAISLFFLLRFRFLLTLQMLTSEWAVCVYWRQICFQILCFLGHLFDDFSLNSKQFWSQLALIIGFYSTSFSWFF